MKVSHSQVMSWFFCRNYWRYSYVEGVVPKRAPEKKFQMGDYLHGKLDIFYQMLKNGFPYEDIPEHMQNFILEDYKADGTNGEVILRALKVFNRYVAEISPVIDEGISVVQTEYHFEVPMVTPKGRDFTLEGYVDLVYQDRNNTLRVRDHKTHNGTGGFWTSGQVNHDVQQTTYIGGLRLLGYNVEGGEVVEINTFDYKDFASIPLDKLFARKRAYRSPEFLAAAMKWYGDVVDDMIDEREFTRSLSRSCDNCYYRDPCFAAFTGKDERKILEIGYKKKDGWSEWHASNQAN